MRMPSLIQGYYNQLELNARFFMDWWILDIYMDRLWTSQPIQRDMALAGLWDQLEQERARRERLQAQGLPTRGCQYCIDGICDAINFFAMNG